MKHFTPVSFESFPGSKNQRELRNLVRARSSAVMERVHTMREQKQVDTSTRNVQNALRTKSAAQRSAWPPAPLRRCGRAQCVDALSLLCCPADAREIDVSLEV